MKIPTDRRRGKEGRSDQLGEGEKGRRGERRPGTAEDEKMN